MVIDFHVHVFPDTIAKRTIAKLEQVSESKACINGSVSGLLTSMKQADVDYSVVLPIVTKPQQFDTINQFAKEISGKNGMLSFGGIHPDNDRIRERIQMISSMGLKGIKLHPDYQGVFIDDERYVEIIKEAIEADLIVSIHAGMDVGIPEPVHCTPKRSAHLLAQLRGRDTHKIVLAHMGGYQYWDQVEEYLVGKDIYMDTSYCMTTMNQKQLIRMIQNHGSDRILFATDSPWVSQKVFVEYLSKLALSEKEKQQILYENAAQLLKL